MCYTQYIFVQSFVVLLNTYDTLCYTQYIFVQSFVVLLNTYVHCVIPNIYLYSLLSFYLTHKYIVLYPIYICTDFCRFTYTQYIFGQSFCTLCYTQYIFVQSFVVLHNTYVHCVIPNIYLYSLLSFYLTHIHCVIPIYICLLSFYLTHMYIVLYPIYICTVFCRFT